MEWRSFWQQHDEYSGFDEPYEGYIKRQKSSTIRKQALCATHDGILVANTCPQAWFDQPPPMPQVPSFMGLGNNAVVGASPVRTDLGSETEEDLIPTAIVIKNIPFAVKKESLVGLMTDLGLPLPYAFNYHFDNGVFRGLAFANFTSADETAAVIDSLNHYDLQGRKLRVEYKKMLPAAERERIEREKRERRGQLEEQHRPLPSHGLQTQPSMTSMSSHIPATSPSPVSARNTKPGESYPATVLSELVS